MSVPQADTMTEPEPRPAGAPRVDRDAALVEALRRGDEAASELLLETYRRLMALRRSSDALARGGIRYLHVSDDAVLYLRESRTERLLCLASRADHEPISTPFTQLETLYGEDAQDGVLPADGPAFHVWRIHG